MMGKETLFPERERAERSGCGRDRKDFPRGGNRKRMNEKERRTTRKNTVRPTAGKDGKQEKKPVRDRQALAPDRGMIWRVIAILAVVCVFVMPYLLYKLADVQIVNHEKWQTRAINQQTRSVTLLPVRGTIYDANMNEVAVSTVVENICLAPANITVNEEKGIDQRPVICRYLADLLDLDYDALMLKANKSDSYYQMVARNVDKSVTDQIRAFIRENKITGIDFYPSSERYYPYGNFASAVIGFTNADGEGAYGVERTYDAILSGQNGRIITAKNRDGDAMPFAYEQYLDAEDGAGVVLTIDHTVQEILLKHLETATIDNDAKGATGVVYDIKTGEVVGMGSYPDFDLNEPRTLSAEAELEISLLAPEERDEARINALYDMWKNAAITEAYEPGSTFKTVTAAMALEENVVSLTDYFYCSGSTHVADWDISCWKHSGHGSLDFTHAVMGSCNCAFMSIGKRIGADTFYHYADLFGLMKKTGIDLPGESSGVFFAENTFGSNEANLAVATFGQRFKVTPIQMIATVAGLANGGVEMKPHVVSAYTDEEGNITHTAEPEVLRSLISAETSKTLCDILEKVVSLGTGRNAYVAGYRVGGKTGTTEKNSANHVHQKYIASFLGVAPCDDPMYAVLILIDEPKGDLHQGGQIAAPVVGKVFSEILPYLGVPAIYTQSEMQTLQVTVPKMTRMSLADAKARARDAGLEVEVVGTSGYVTAQLPAYGASISYRTPAVLYCGEQPADEEAEVPSVVGLSYASAVERMEKAGFYVHATGAVQTSAGDSVRARRQSVRSGTKLPKGSVIDVEFLDNNTYNTGE